MNADFWNQRYASAEFAYGREPNTLLKAFLKGKIPGTILFPAEGEGRNAVYAASLGWNVFAFDPSIAGKEKAERLAIEKGVQLNYVVSDFETYDISQNYFDCIAIIFSHLPIESRKAAFRRTLGFLKPGGSLFLMGFSESQFGKGSGGPKELNMLFSRNQLLEDFEGLKDIFIEEMEMNLDEGPFHQGRASIIQLLAKK